MANVLIVGTRGSGKTILMTTLAKRYQTETDGLIMIAKDRETMEFTERNWRILTQDRDWPPQTPPGSFVNLQWSLHVNGKDGSDIKMVDFAGETFREVFGKTDLSDPTAKLEAMKNSELASLIQCLDEANIVIVLVNLRDFINQMDPAVQYETQWALRGFLDYIVSTRNIPQGQVAVVLTQVDKYQNLVRTDLNWREVVQEHLAHIQIVPSFPNISYLGVSAVSETEVASADSGEVFDRPQSGFKSWHLDTLGSFLKDVTVQICNNEYQQRIHSKAVELLSFNKNILLEFDRRVAVETARLRPAELMGGIAGIIVDLFLNFSLGGNLWSILFLAVPGWFGGKRAGKYILTRGHNPDETVLNKFIILAKQGSMQAAYNLAVIYNKNNNSIAAYELLLQAANQGHADSAFMLGWFYDEGIGVRQNKVEADKWFRLATNFPVPVNAPQFLSA